MNDPLVLSIRAMRANAQAQVLAVQGLVAQCDALLAGLNAREDDTDGPGGDDAVRCPACGWTEHQAPAAAGVYVCGNRECGTNHRNGRIVE